MHKMEPPTLKIAKVGPCQENCVSWDYEQLPHIATVDRKSKVRDGWSGSWELPVINLIFNSNMLELKIISKYFY